LWSNFPENEKVLSSIDKASLASASTLFREKGVLTEEAAGTMAKVLAQWANIKISLQWAVSGTVFIANQLCEGTHVFLCRQGVDKFAIKDVSAPSNTHSIFCAPQLTSGDPVCSNSLIRAIAGGASLNQIDFPRSVYPEHPMEFSLPLSAACKPDGLARAQKIWAHVEQKLPSLRLGDFTDQDSMGTTNLGTVFKVCSLLLCQGVLRKYVLYFDSMTFQHVFLSNQNVVYVGSGIGKSAWLFSTLAQVDVKMFAFERFPRHHDMSAQALKAIRSDRNVHNLKVSSLYQNGSPVSV
jgi:hypothetical protein